MTPEISEFSFGFALTNELVGWAKLTAAPIFPSLIEEGKATGGYDVALDMPGKPMFLQFKRADCMVRSSATEISTYGLPLALPFYRFSITEKNKSFQHESLLQLDNGDNIVFYAAPRFHTFDEINDAWTSQEVAARSIFIDPAQIRSIADNKRHHISYDEKLAYFCSEPEPIEFKTADDVGELIEEKITDDPRSVRDQLTDWHQSILQAERFSREIITKRMRARISEPESVTELDMRRREARPTSAFRAQPRKRLNAENRLLREISDRALHWFGAQLFVVQRRDG